MSQYTKGPWRTIEHSWSTTGIYVDDEHVAKDWRIGELDIQNEVTEENQEKLEGIMRANARLIAAAPELLEALKVILDGFEQGVFVRDITRDAESSWAVRLLPFIAALGKARAAIAKAESQEEPKG